MVNGATPATYASSGCCAFESFLMWEVIVAFPIGYALGWAVDRVISNKTMGYYITISSSVVAGAILLLLIIYGGPPVYVISIIIFIMQITIIILSLVVASILFARSKPDNA